MQRYGLRIIGVIEESPGKEPTAPHRPDRQRPEAPGCARRFRGAPVQLPRRRRGDRPRGGSPGALLPRSRRRAEPARQGHVRQTYAEGPLPDGEGDEVKAVEIDHLSVSIGGREVLRETFPLKRGPFSGSCAQWRENDSP
ncbi:MAG: hypothetical protein MZV70_44925 [Desulfobacterales bacterium]|nr:hypothetical protein [Desulfobacterales bacterium]